MITLMIGGKILFENTSLGTSTERYFRAFLQRQLSKSSSTPDLTPVVIVNLGRLTPSRSPDGTQVATPTDPLKSLINHLIDSNVSAIGIDVDFGSIPNQPNTPDHLNFFKFCKETSEKTNIPIVLGIDDGVNRPSNCWFDSEDFSGLAGWISIQPDHLRLPYEVKPPNSAHRLKGFAAKLLELSNESFEPPFFLRWAGRVVHEHSIEDWTVWEYLVNFGDLTRLADGTLDYDPRYPDAIDRRKLANRIVLIGDSIGDATDTFVLPSLSDEPIPGVLVHACGAMTALNRYLIELTHLGRIGIDIVFSLLALLPMCLACRHYNKKYPNRQPNEEFAFWFFTTISSAIVLVVGFMLLIHTRIFWHDFILVSIALLIHRGIHRQITSLVSSVKHRFITGMDLYQSKATK